MEANHEASTEEYEAKRKELEGVWQPIIMKVYQESGGQEGGMPGGMPGGFPGAGGFPGGAGGFPGGGPRRCWSRSWTKWKDQSLMTSINTTLHY
jgi:heat shock protein 1/8